MGGQGSGRKPNLKPWDQRPSESALAFEAFALYRDLGSQRSQASVAKQLGKSTQLIARWASEHGWSDRVRKWDRFLDQKGQEAAVREVEKMRERHIQIAMGLQQVGVKELKKLVERAEKSGRALNVDQLIRVVEQGTKMERLNRGEPTDHTSSEVTQSWADLVRKSREQ